MSYSLIALDLDGTLLTDNHQIPPKTLDLLERIRKNGTFIAICTGRSALSVRPLLAGHSFSTHYITDNGGTVLDTRTDQALYASAMPRSYLQTMRLIMRTHGVHCDVTTTDYIYVEHLSDEMLAIYKKFLMEPVAIGDLRKAPADPMKFTVSGEPTVLDGVESELNERYGHDLMIVRSGETFIDIMKKGTSKGKALALLAQQLDIPPSKMLAMGNYYNDVEMLQYAGKGIAMANAPDDLKAMADDVTLSNNEEGVRRALEKWMHTYRHAE